jgi:hypothetical protein
MAKSVKPSPERKAELDAIRKWAAENGIECPSRGRIPQRVVAAYQEAWGVPQETPKKRLVVRFDPETLSFWPENATHKRETNKLRATVIQYVENTGARSPSNGKFTSQRFTVNIDGEKWVGQVKNGTDVVRLRPYEEAYSDARV